MNKVWGVAVVLLLLLSGCNKKIADIFNRNSTKLVVNDADFEYLSAKAKIDFESGKTSFSATANIRIHKDSVIWMSLTPGLGIEAARVLITRDSVSIVNKIDKVYMHYDFVELSQKFDFDLNYHLVEAAVLGNLIYPYDKERVVKNQATYSYSQQHGIFFFENFIGAKSAKLEEVRVRDTVSNNSFSVNYTDFQLVEDQIFPFKITARLDRRDDSKGDTKVGIEFKQTTIEKKEIKFPFNVPQKYERK